MTQTIIAALLALSIAPGAQPATAAKDVTLDQAISGVQKFYESVTDFKAKFKQTVKNKNLPTARKSRGTVYFKVPGMMRWDYTQPEKMYYVSDGKVLWNYVPEDRTAIKLNVEDSDLYASMKFLFGKGDLKKDFLPTLLEPKDGNVRLRLEPKVKQSGYDHIVLNLDPKTFKIRSTELVDPTGSTSHVTFEKVQINEQLDKPLDPKAFTGFQPPKGVRVQDLTKRGKGATTP